MGKLEEAERPLLDPKFCRGTIPRARAAGENRPRTWGPFWDHTLCAVMNDLRVMNVLHVHIAPHTRGDQGKRVTAIYWGSKWFALQR